MTENTKVLHRFECRAEGLDCSDCLYQLISWSQYEPVPKCEFDCPQTVECQLVIRADKDR